MTFEEYKKQFEIFCKIDTPEKLAICESQFRKHLQNIEDENYFEPYEFRTGNDIGSIYEQNLKAILSFDKIDENQLAFLIKPSFKPECLLLIERHSDKYSLTLTTLITNYWSIFYANNNVTEVGKTTLTAVLRNDIGDKLFTLLDTAILEARQPMPGRFVLDGVVYILSRILNSNQAIVFKHSPSEDSQTGRIINILLFIIDNMNSLDNTILSALEKQINDLSQNK
jgi:hypothetical protein